MSTTPVPYGLTPVAPASVRGPGVVQVRRDVFWQNVVREILLGLAAAAAAETGRLSATPTGAANGADPVSEMFDGRMGLITSLGQRIPIADVVPVFSVSSPSSPEDRTRSTDVQCTVFRIRTPMGESYTLPVTQIVGFHSLSDALADQLEAAAQEMEAIDDDGSRLPFGFAAYTALAHSEAAAKNGPEAGAGIGTE